MFKLRRRTVAEAAVSNLPFCAMCGTAIRVDAASGRCALGHRVVVPATTLPASAEAPPAADTALVEPAYEVTPAYDVTGYGGYDAVTAYVDEHAGGIAGEGLYEAYQSADAAGRTVTWEDVVAPSTGTSGVYDDYLTWDEPASGSSSLDVDTAELPVADETAAAGDESPAFMPLPGGDLLDELDEAAYARRRTAGTIGATVGFSALAFASIAVLPF